MIPIKLTPKHAEPNLLYPYYFVWGNTPKRTTLKGRRLKVLARFRFNSALVEFENGQRECISRNAIRKVKDDQTPQAPQA